MFLNMVISQLTVKSCEWCIEGNGRRIEKIGIRDNLIGREYSIRTKGKGPSPEHALCDGPSREETKYYYSNILA